MKQYVEFIDVNPLHTQIHRTKYTIILTIINLFPKRISVYCNSFLRKRYYQPLSLGSFIFCPYLCNITFTFSKIALVLMTI